ncbi:MAG TPA: hypothetical protein PLU53_01130 [Bacteroidia bacterium]|nr:hypothetical protein [Bacteroidia bacterium]
MKKIFLFLFVIVNILTTQMVKADYVTSFGARVGKFATGASLKHFFDARGNVGFEIWGTITREANSGYMGKAFFVKQLPIMDSKLQIPVDVVIGIGGHFGLFKDNYYRIKNGEPEYYHHNALNAGIDAQFGLEYNSRRVPVTVGIDVNPYYGLLNPGPEWLDMGLTVRFKF